jgi:O-methyltransferase
MKSLKTAVKRGFAAAGLSISRQAAPKPTKPPGPYSGVKSTAQYTPWHIDEKFRECYDIVRDFTLVDRNRCYCLWKAVEQTAKLSEGAILEVGVWRGGSGGLIAERARQCGIPDTIYLCDTFSGIVKAGAEDPSYKGGEHADTSLAVTERLLSEVMHLDNIRLLQGIFPEETGNLVGEERFRLCHVDVDVYQSAKDVVEWVLPKMVIGGVIVFDDYGFDTCAGVRRFVDELLERKNLMGFYNLSGQAVAVKIADA